MNEETRKNLKFNYIVNLIDGGFFGFGLGFASFSTMLPLFVANLTSSATLIGLIPAIHNMGWQLPQLLTAKKISRLSRMKPYVLMATVQERLPFLGFAIVAWLIPSIGYQAALVITFLLLIVQGLGAGITANAWSIMIGKVIPGELRATFFGFQSAFANFFSSFAAIVAGFVLVKIPFPNNFALCFVACIGLMCVSWFFLGQTKEPDVQIEHFPVVEEPLSKNILRILKKDANFRWFMIARIIFQFGMMSFAFYTVYAVQHLHINETSAGFLASALMISQTAANPLLGWIADRWSRKGVLEIGALTTLLSSLLAWLAPDLAWFFLVMVLTGFSNTAFWTIGLAVSLEFGPEQEQATYVGMSNTLIAPSTILAPLLGGWLADMGGYPACFIAGTIFSLVTYLMLHFFVNDPERPAKAQPLISVIEEKP